MANNTFSNMKDLEKAILKQYIKKLKNEIDRFVAEWKQNNMIYQDYPIFGQIEKVIEIDTKIVGNSTVELSVHFGDMKSFGQNFSFDEESKNQIVYESFVDDFESYCRENNIPIKRA